MKSQSSSSQPANRLGWFFIKNNIRADGAISWDTTDALSRILAVLVLIVRKLIRYTVLVIISVVLACAIIYAYWSSSLCQNQIAVWLVKSEMEPAGLDFHYKAKAVDRGKSAIYCYRQEDREDPVIGFMVDTKSYEIGALKISP